VPRDQPFAKVLKDGVLICKLINVIQPGSVKSIKTKGGNFQLMENIAAFQKACKKYGVPQEEIFQTADLFEARNIDQVALSLFCLGRVAKNKNFDGPTLGPKMSEAQKREFTEEQLRAGDGQISLQAGSNKGASQAGISMGKQRMIVD